MGRNIFIITDNQRPTWLSEKKFSDKKISIVDHTQIIHEKYLPTFNSHVIEAHLHLIDGLAENFIYFNDDVFVARPLSPGHFFKGNGLASLFASNKSLNGMLARGVETPTLNASLKGSSILEKQYNVVIDKPLVHTYVPLKKSYFSLAWESYEEEITKFLTSRFRGRSDLNLATFLVPWLMYINGNACYQTDICYYFNVRSTASRRYYNELLKGKKQGYCHIRFALMILIPKALKCQNIAKNLKNF